MKKYLIKAKLKYALENMRRKLNKEHLEELKQEDGKLHSKSYYHFWYPKRSKWTMQPKKKWK